MRGNEQLTPLRLSPKDMLDGMDNLRRLYRKYRPVRGSAWVGRAG